MTKSFEFVARYKMGHTNMSVRTTIDARNVMLVQEIVEEVPEFMDGYLSVVETGSGARLLSSEPYDSMKEKYQAAMTAPE